MTALPSEKIDAVIVGSGAAGSHFAARLAEAGKRVAILEAGPARPKDDLVSSMLWARRLRRSSKQSRKRQKPSRAMHLLVMSRCGRR